MLIQVDVDGTLYDFDKVAAQIAPELGIKWPRQSTCWLPPNSVLREDGLPCAPEDLSKLFRRVHSREIITTIKPYPNVVVVLRQLVTDYPDIEVAYVSDRNEQQTNALRDWLQDNHFLASEDAHVVATRDKRHWMRERRPEIVIDDRVRTMLMARFELGSYVTSITHPHNVNLTGEVEGIYMAKDWTEIDNILRMTIIPKLNESSASREKQLV